MPASLIDQIDKFEALLAEMKEATRQSHEALKELKKYRKEVDRLLSTEVRDMVGDAASEVVKMELAKIGPEIRKQTSLIYDSVGTQIDKLITICLGSEYSRKREHEDLRPVLAAKLRELIEEVIDSSPNTNFK